MQSWFLFVFFILEAKVNTFCLGEEPTHICVSA